MRLIPVLDLRGGAVVKAVRGERAGYQLLRSPLAPAAGSAPLPLARALLTASASDTLYLADLDALTGGAVQTAALRALLQGLDEEARARGALPPRLWLDAGWPTLDAVQASLDALGALAARVDPVLASEALRPGELARLAGASPGAAVDWAPRALLSLDRRGAARLDAGGCWDEPAHWPPRLILMTLERVGSDSGPALDELGALLARAAGRAVYGAGGLRGAADRAAAAACGAAGWLVASALHDGRFGIDAEGGAAG